MTPIMQENLLDMTMLMFWIGILCGALAGWHSPRVLSWIAARCMTRIDILRASASAKRDGLRYWTEKLEQPERTEKDHPWPG